MLRRAVVLALTFSLVVPNLVAGAVWTDQLDYSPGSVVTISGDNSNDAGYLPGETVNVVVFGPNGYEASCSATVDVSGFWTCQVTLWNNELALGEYAYTATGQASGVSETSSFTDAFPTAAAVTSSINPSSSGQSVTFTATVTYTGAGGGAPPAGTVVTVGQVRFGTGGNCAGGFTQIQAATTVDSNGQVTFTTSTLPAGITTIRACYDGTGGATGTQNSSGTVVQTVNATPSDNTPPETTITGNPSDPSNSSSASFSFTGSDNVTPPASLAFECKLDSGSFAACSSPQAYVGLGDGSHTFEVRAIDGAGNVDSTPASYTWTIDTVGPVITATATKMDLSTYLADTWTNQDVTVVFTCADDSGLLSVDDVADDGGTISTDTASGSFTAPGSDCVDLAGNEAVSVIFGPIKVDKTAPVITDLGPTTSANGAGWYNADVTNGFSLDADISGPDAACAAAFPSNSQSKTTTGEGMALTVTSDGCTDLAGNTATGVSSAAFKVDKTAPTSVAFGTHGLTEGESYYFGFVPAGPTTCTANYDISGESGCVVSGYGTSVGPHTVQAAATDVAGNTGYAYLNYSVLGWTLTGFYKPVDMGWVNTVKGGSTVPLKFEVFAGSLELTSTSFIGAVFKTRQVNCNEFGDVLYDDVEITTTGGTSFRYDSESGQFIQNWQTPRKPGTCWVTTMTTADGSFLAASFKLK